MNKSDFTYILQNPQHIRVQQMDVLNEVVNTYPYFQAARALQLKGLKNKESYAYNQELKTTAAHTTDRSILFDFITSKVFNQNKISKAIKQNSEHIKEIIVNEVEDISVNKSVTIDDALKQHIQNTEGVLDPKLFEKKVNQENITHFLSLQNEAPKKTIKDNDTNQKKEKAKDTLQLGKPLEFDNKETHSFSEWLKITSFKPIQREGSKYNLKETKAENKDKIQTEKTDIIKEKFNLIDRFLENKPKIIPTKELRKVTISNSNKVAQDKLMTETLAKIYLEQNNYEKAIQSYKILSLKYPEKSGFFADQIEAVKELQENNTEKE